MTRIESDKKEITKSAAEVYNFLADFNNFGKLLPSQIADWKCTTDDCQFTILGMGSIGLRHFSKTPNSEIVMEKNGKAPFEFKLICAIEENGNFSKAQLFMDAELNSVLKMMVEKPMKNFLNMLVNKLAEMP